MAIDDKLQYFYDSTISTIQTVGEEELDHMNASLKKEYNRFRTALEREADLQQRLHMTETKRELMKELSQEKLALRRRQARKEGAIKEALFEEVGQMLDEFRATPAYLELLVRMSKKIRTFAGEDEVKIYICPSDGHLESALERELQFAVYVSSVPFNGGIQAEIPSRNIFINNSFSSRMRDAKEDYVPRME